MAVDKEPYRIKVSDLQVRCLEIAGDEVTQLATGLRQIYQDISESREGNGTLLTGSRIVKNTIGVGLDDISQIFLGMAQSLRKKGRVEILSVFESGSGLTRPVSFGYRFFGNPENYEEYIRPLHSFAPVSWGVNRAVVSTLFDSDDLKGEQIKSLSSSPDRFYRALEAHRTVILLYEPIIDYQI